jgi:hypothetical protein
VPWDPVERSLLSVKVVLDSKSVGYGRVSESVLKALEEIGGFSESMMHIGVLMVLFFQRRLFKGAFIKQLYQVNDEPKSEKRVKAKKKILQNVDNQGMIEEHNARSMLEHMIHRKRFHYTYKESFNYLLRCMCLRKMRDDENSVAVELIKKPHDLYNKGNRKLERELDIVNLVRSIRKLRLMARVMLTPAERMLLKFQRKNVIETTSSSSDSDHYSFDTIKLLNSRKGLVKL